MKKIEIPAPIKNKLNENQQTVIKHMQIRIAEKVSPDQALSTLMKLASISVNLSADQTLLFLTGFYEIVNGIWGEKFLKAKDPAQVEPAQETKRIRQDLKSLERHLSAIAGLLEDHRTNGLISSWSGDYDLRKNIGHYRGAARALNRVKPQIFYTRGVVPAMVASDIEKLMLQADIKPRRTVTGTWAQLFELAYASAGFEITKDLFKNSIKRQGKNCDENIPKLP
jgi:hypothetical protein